jgi:hypothetical protein
MIEEEYKTLNFVHHFGVMRTDLLLAEDWRRKQLAAVANLKLLAVVNYMVESIVITVVELSVLCVVDRIVYYLLEEEVVPNFELFEEPVLGTEKQLNFDIELFVEI